MKLNFVSRKKNCSIWTLGKWRQVNTRWKKPSFSLGGVNFAREKVREDCWQKSQSKKEFFSSSSSYPIECKQYIQVEWLDMFGDGTFLLTLSNKTTDNLKFENNFS